MSNIRAAVSRLSFARKSKLRVADAKQGLVIFKPDPGKKFDYQELEKSYKRESYGIKSVELTATGTVEERPDPQDPSGKVLVLNVKDMGNVFRLRLGEKVSVTLPAPGTEAKVAGLLEPGKDGPAALVVKSVASASK